jgi:hypothetical protein
MKKLTANRGQRRDGEGRDVIETLSNCRQEWSRTSRADKTG